MAYQDIYITNTGDMWDLIAYRVYGSERYMRELLIANSQYRDIVIFAAGVRIVCPDIDIASASPLPPWKVR